MANPFFISTPGSCVLPLAHIRPREAPDPARVRRARAQWTPPRRDPSQTSPPVRDPVRQ